MRKTKRTKLQTAAAKSAKKVPTNGASRLQERFAKAESEGSLNNTRRTLLRAVLDNPAEAYFLSSRELAKRFDMDTATVVRTVQALGYKRFADFSADLREHFVMRITPYRVMKTAAEEGRSPADQVAASIEKDIENIMEMRSRLDANGILQAARQILRANRVLVIGVDYAAALAWYLDYHLTVFGIRSEAPVGTTGSLQHRLRTLTSKDFVILISFGRCLRATVDAAVEARSHGVPTLAITDSEFSPLARNCNAHLLASVSNSSLAASYTAAVALLSCILVACAHIAPERSLDMLRRIEQDKHSSERWAE
jgi:DNA-binding MurR/RpiR family transcriptional regulator